MSSLTLSHDKTALINLLFLFFQGEGMDGRWLYFLSFLSDSWLKRGFTYHILFCSVIAFDPPYLLAVFVLRSVMISDDDDEDAVRQPKIVC